MSPRKDELTRRKAVNAMVTTAPSRRDASSIPFEEALRVLLALEAGEEHPEAIGTELPAIVSHWLQCPEESPILLGQRTGQRWATMLQNYASLAPSFARSARATRGKRPFSIDFSGVSFPPSSTTAFRFIDLFAGIGGFRIALQESGGRCVFSSEWERHAQETYKANYGETPFGDIRQFTGDDVSDRRLRSLIPDHDVLAGGFPCQPFSRAGVSARTSLGQSHGFSCQIQGTLFFDMMRIARVKQPRVLFLENVKNLRSHDGGRTFDRIQTTIEKDLGYSFHSAVIDASPLVPQRRKRCYMVCFRDKTPFEMPSVEGPPLPLSSILEDAPAARYTLSERMWQGHIRRTQRNLDRGTGFTAYAADISKPSNTLVARYYKDGKECLVPQVDANPRLLTPRECARLQGYPEKFVIHPVDSQAYRQFGNSVALPVVQAIADRIAEKLKVKK